MMRPNRTHPCSVSPLLIISHWKSAFFDILHIISPLPNPASTASMGGLSKCGISFLDGFVVGPSVYVNGGLASGFLDGDRLGTVDQSDGQWEDSGP